MADTVMGVFLPTLEAKGEAPADAVAAARHAEDLGFESVWTVDQLVAGTGAPILDSTVVLSAAAGATHTIRLGFGVMIVPLHPVLWVAKQVAALQHVSGSRAILGVGAGGDRHNLAWDAAGVPRTERGRRLDAALEVLPDLIAGEPVDHDGRTVQLAPGAPVPPIVVGGMAEAALARTAAHADGWFSLPLPPARLAPGIERLGELAAGLGRPRPTVTAGMQVAIEGDPALPGDDEQVRILTDPDGRYGMPAEAVREMLVTGGPPAVAERITELRTVGVERVVVDIVGGDWDHQATLVAEAAALAG